MSVALLNRELIQKHDVAGPRYTSYPTAPEWSCDVDAEIYKKKLKNFSESNKSLSLYIHIPFCESLCYFCACNKIIRKKTDRYGDTYIDYLKHELSLLTEHFGKGVPVRQVHWGGGTPTYLTEAQMERLFSIVAHHFEIDFNGEVAIELDPRTVDRSKIQKLKRLGFNRVSMGIQDYDSTVQKAINRIQPFELVRKVYEDCRDASFVSVNMDLIYGLPHQTCQSFYDTVDKTIQLKPDRVALYSYAHVPWLSSHQKRMPLEHLPDSDEKLDIFLQARRQFEDAGYIAIAMDHFALPTDEMAEAFQTGTLYRNFMGYTLKPSDDFIGLGVSAIGFLQNTFIQNHKSMEAYYQDIDIGKLPVERGKELSRDDRIRQWLIHQLMCRFTVDKKECEKIFKIDFDDYFDEEKIHLQKCEKDGLIQYNETGSRRPL